jgi:glycosyltransferase involved in cell wall biosynthesis
MSVSSQKRPRVCMIAYTVYATDGRVRLEAESVSKWGYDVSFLVLKAENTPRRHDLCGVDVIELNVAKYRGKNKLRYLFSYLHFLLLAFARCTALFFETGLQVVHVHNMPDLLAFAALIPRILGCKVLLDVHDSVPETYAGKFAEPSGILFRLLALEERLSCAFAHRVICVNHPQRDTLVNRGIPAKKIHIVITMPKFVSRPVDAGKREERTAFRLVNHGTISNRLGIDLLVQASAKLVSRIPGFELHIIGGGDDQASMVQLTESLGLAEKTFFHKGVPWDALPEKLRQMDVGIVANRNSIATRLMLPSKLIDYVNLDIPAIVPRLPAIEYYFTPDMVMFFEPDNVDSMVEAVWQLYCDKERRATQAVKARSFVEKYEWDRNRSLRNLYAELCDGVVRVEELETDPELKERV